MIPGVNFARQLDSKTYTVERASKGRLAQKQRMTLRSVRSLRLGGSAMASAEGVILETQKLVKAFNGFVAVDGVSLQVRRGEIHALIGPNGAGKTTFFNLLTKFLQPTSGTIVYQGRNITRDQPADVARRGIARSFQICAVFPHLT